jgi:metal-responsive CopG/Arc/MetJ family transcriptional regulator
MVQEKNNEGPTAKESAAAVRASISFPADIYQSLEEIARRKKVSLAWVVREAAERYVADQWSLFVSGRF